MCKKKHISCICCFAEPSGIRVLDNDAARYVALCLFRFWFLVSCLVVCIEVKSIKGCLLFLVKITEVVVFVAS